MFTGSNLRQEFNKQIITDMLDVSGWRLKNEAGRCG
jgi:hypothetical protein